MPVKPAENTSTGNVRGWEAGRASSVACVCTPASGSNVVSGTPKTVAKLRTSASPSRKYGARLPPRPGAAGYHASTSTFLTAPGGPNVSGRASSTSRQVVVPTAYGPVGRGASKPTATPAASTPTGRRGGEGRGGRRTRTRTRTANAGA